MKKVQWTRWERSVVFESIDEACELRFLSLAFPGIVMRAD